jgi:hypothetical protein
MYYYPLDVYRHYETIDVRKVAPIDFGKCDVVSSGVRFKTSVDTLGSFDLLPE